MAVWTLALMGLAVLVGAITTRLTGIGFVLVASPFLVLLLGPDTGVSLLLVLGLIAAPVLVAQLWRDVEPKKALLLLLPAAVGVVPGALLAGVLPVPVLSIAVGSLVLVAITATVASERARVFKGTPGLLSAGFLSGFMNAMAGIGGPAIVLYALSTNWSHAAFVATIQLYFAGLNVVTLFARGLPSLPVEAWVVSSAALVAGLVIGNLLAKRVSAAGARWLVIGASVAGGVATIVKGVLAL